MQIIHWFVSYFDYAYLTRLCDITKPTLLDHWIAVDPAPPDGIFATMIV